LPYGRPNLALAGLLVNVVNSGPDNLQCCHISRAQSWHTSRRNARACMTASTGSLRVVPPADKPCRGLLVQALQLQLLQLVAPLTSIAPRVPRRLDVAAIAVISSFDV